MPFMRAAKRAALICPDCGAPLGAELDFFAALGVPRKLVLDPRELERIYHEAGRRIHPDRFATGTPAVRQASLKSTALLTRSYRTLRDPVSRGRYWLELIGEKLAENNKRVPPELAETGIRSTGAARRAAARRTTEAPTRSAPRSKGGARSLKDW